MPGLHARTRPQGRRSADQSERRCDCVGPSAGHVGRTADRHGHDRVGTTEGALCAVHDVRRRRAGNGRHHRESMKVQSFVQGQWCFGTGPGVELFHAGNGEKIAEVSSEGLDFEGALEYGRNVGGPKLRAMTFHERARMLKALGKFLTERKEEFYKVSYATGATRFDSWLDIDGGISTLFTYASKGRKEFPDERFHVEGEPETLSKAGTFMGRHICVPLEGAAIHINAFNFPGFCLVFYGSGGACG